MTRCSIYLCTRNRVAHLRRTLASLAQVRVPADCAVELIVIDNGSTDATPDAVRQAVLPAMRIRYVFESRPGKARAVNAVLPTLQSDILIGLDDDVVVPADWLVELIAPIRDGAADAVAGFVRIAPALQRPWMTDLHLLMVAGTDRLDPADPSDMVGANMAFARRVLEKVPGFDPELGPGASGFGEDTLFTHQLKSAGFRIAGRPQATVEHHFDPRRLQRSAWLLGAGCYGQSHAYLHHHWHHASYSLPQMRLWYCRLRLALWRIAHAGQTRLPEGIQRQEIIYVRSVANYREFLIQRRRPRTYAIPHALRCRDGGAV